MKKLLIFTIAFFAMQGINVAVKANIKSDTTVIEFVDKGLKKRLSVQSESKNFTFKIPSNLNLENLLAEIGVDSNETKKTIISIERGGKRDTVIAISREGHKIKIIAKDPRISNSDSLKREPRRRYDGDQNEQENEEKNNEFDQNENRREMNDTYQNNNRNYDNENDDNQANENDSKEKLGNSKYFSRKDFGLYVGLNGLEAEKGTIPTLNRWGSRYVALSWRKNKTFIKTKSLDAALSLGPEIAWYNFRFANNVFAKNTNDNIELIKATENLRKSKLVVPTFNVPILLNLGLKQSKINFAVGGYVGWKIGGYSRIDTNEDKKNKDKGNFGLTSFKKGLTAEIGKKNGLTVFIRRDLDPMFKSDQTNINTNLTGWSFGVRL